MIYYALESRITLIVQSGANDVVTLSVTGEAQEVAVIAAMEHAEQNSVLYLPVFAHDAAADIVAGYYVSKGLEVQTLKAIHPAVKNAIAGAVAIYDDNASLIRQYKSKVSSSVSPDQVLAIQDRSQPGDIIVMDEQLARNSTGKAGVYQIVVATKPLTRIEHIVLQGAAYALIAKAEEVTPSHSLWDAYPCRVIVTDINPGQRVSLFINNEAHSYTSGRAIGLGGVAAILARAIQESNADAIPRTFERILRRFELNPPTDANISLSVMDNIRNVSFQAQYDQLTGIGNRHSADQYLAQGAYNAVGIIDIDHFKAINDTYGHDFGDICIKACANAIGKTLRSRDKVFRWGGEEFLIVLDINQADDDIVKTLEGVAERIRLAVESIDFIGALNEYEKNAQPDRVAITISLGVALLDGSSGWREALKNADTGVYQAKNGGRNQFKIVS